MTASRFLKLIIFYCLVLFLMFFSFWPHVYVKTSVLAWLLIVLSVRTQQWDPKFTHLYVFYTRQNQLKTFMNLLMWFTSHLQYHVFISCVVDIVNCTYTIQTHYSYITAGCSGVLHGRVSDSWARGCGFDSHPVHSASNLEQVANLLCAQANSASYPQRDGNE